MKHRRLVAALTVVLVASSVATASSAAAAGCTVTTSRSSTWTKVEARSGCLNVQARIDKYVSGSGIRTTLGYQGPTLSVAVDYSGVWSGAYYRTRSTAGTWTGWISF
ncbi:hypothetical protein [Sanguibacter antarcticus]|uniref:Secreted protein n=1 Tax=Sanguibacter antarcticus TaxID=372484 RepID=A0A2A9E9Y6_9MICO|nr:hypothetical protein [Sanguibacter antarcticus]PFG35030.1 hypothetical protein ATL42_2963 [Sanguibacter antarcticus]